MIWIKQGSILNWNIYRGDIMLDDFIKVMAMPQDIVEKYRTMVPDELIQIWQNQGIGTFLGGYLKIINPEEYRDLLDSTYFRGDLAVPIFVTAFGDIITFEENRYLRLVKYKDGVFEIILENFLFFLKFLKDEDFQKDYFEIDLYKSALKQYGDLDYDYCFGFVTLLGLGGQKTVENIDKVKIKEHIYIISELVGNIGM